MSEVDEKEEQECGSWPLGRRCGRGEKGEGGGGVLLSGVSRALPNLHVIED